MAVCRPDTEGFVNVQAGLCLTFTLAVDENDEPLMPNYRTDGYISAIAQSGGIGFSFFDRGRPKELSFNYILTTGNEAALEELDFVDHLIDSNETDIFTLFMEDVKTPKKLARVGERRFRPANRLSSPKSAGPMPANAPQPRRPRRLPGLVPVTAPCSSATASLWATTSRRLSTSLPDSRIRVICCPPANGSAPPR
ncbi:MAG: hypothetical protein VXV97_13475, partial [Pseudomonadota bacterium]|nr:hypothetical protein [Pseudomonadota bacterium]